MIEERLEEFMQHVNIKNDKISEYVNNDKCLRYPLNTPQLLCRVDKLELDKTELNIAKFKQQIENKDYETKDIVKLVPKNEITKIDADKYTVAEKKVKGVRVYNLSNQIGIHNTYETPEEAFKICEEINKKVFDELCK